MQKTIENKGQLKTEPHLVGRINIPPADIVQRLRSSEPFPVCPYDRRSPDYWTTPDDDPCRVCGTLNEPGAPDLCRGADTRVMSEAATEIERLRAIITTLKASY